MTARSRPPPVYRRTWFWLLALVAPVVIGGAFPVLDAVEDRIEAARTDEMAARLIDVARLDEPRGARAMADALRRFIIDNSEFRIDEEFYRHWDDPAHLLEHASLHALGQGEPPHTECSTRTQMAKIILGKLGYVARSIITYDPEETLASHVFLEFLNPQTGRWEAQDLLYDVYWTHRSDGRRLGAHEVVASRLDELVPCTAPGQCGWSRASPDGMSVTNLRPLLGLAVIGGEQRLLVNAVRETAERLAALCAADDEACSGQIIYLAEHPHHAERLAQAFAAMAADPK